MVLGLQIQLEELDQKIVVRMNGRIDASSAPLLERKLSALLEEGRDKILLDFNRVDYLSSAGMRVLLSVMKKLRVKRGSLILFALNDEVLEIVRMAGFDKILHICSSEKEALQFNK